MHQILWNQDILHEVLEHVAYERHESDDHRYSKTSLARCARVCRVFSDPALTLLWRTISQLSHLLRIFASLQIVNRYDGTGIVYGLTGSISEDEWARFQYYARRITMLLLQDHTNTELPIHPSVFSQLTSRAHGKPLFPALRDIVWSPDQQVTCGPDLLFISPSLRTVDIVLAHEDIVLVPSTEDNSIERFLSSLHSSSPSLRELKIGIAAKPNVLPIVSTFKGLRSLTLPSVAVSQLEHCCAGMETLAFLRVTVTGGNGNAPGCSGFPALQDLSLDGDIPSMIDLLNHISSPVLRVIDLDDGHSGSPWREWHPLFAVVGSRFAESMSSLIVVLGSPSIRKFDIPFIDSFRPLLQLHQLESVHIDSSCMPLWLEDNDIHDIAKSWPKLRSFEFYYCEEPGLLFPTFYSLVEFARNCVDLWRLDLGPLRINPEHRDISSFPLSSHALKMLCFKVDAEVASDTQVTHVAHFLDRIFPDIDTNVELGPSHELLMPVFARVAMLQHARREERERFLQLDDVDDDDSD